MNLNLGTLHIPLEPYQYEAHFIKTKLIIMAITCVLIIGYNQLQPMHDLPLDCQKFKNTHWGRDHLDLR